MDHRFLKYDASTWDDPDFAAIQTHAAGLFDGSTADPLPPLPADDERAKLLLAEWFSMLDDMICARETLDGLRPAAGRSVAPEDGIAFRIRQGIIEFTGGRSAWSSRLAPAFRSDGSSIIFSDILALDGAYALLELRGSDRGPRLIVEGGGKNQNKFHISLYTRGIQVEKSLLGTKISWDLGSCDPGHYQLKCNNITALSFQIQE